MNRRRALAGLGAALAAGPARPQTPPRINRLGVLALTAEAERTNREMLFPELERLGFILGRNLAFEMRIGSADVLPILARELLTGRPDVVVTIGSLPTRTMLDATKSVPIVMFSDDPVGQGFAASYARPGGNVTGIANLVQSLHAKRLELLIEVLPSARRVGALLKTSSTLRAAVERALDQSASARGVVLTIAHADSAAEYPAAFAALGAARVEGLVIGADPLFSADASLLAVLAREAGFPTICEWAEMARSGCMLGYGPDRLALRRRMADQIARILRGAAPGDIPIEQPTRFELAINLPTARALGVMIPPTMVARADEVIE